VSIQRILKIRYLILGFAQTPGKIVSDGPTSRIAFCGSLLDRVLLFLPTKAEQSSLLALAALAHLLSRDSAV
jgi:hypothetical protein